nr:hypothetical protein BN993_06968 [Virgibacillus halodenitrificans]
MLTTIPSNPLMKMIQSLPKLGSTANIAVQTYFVPS